MSKVISRGLGKRNSILTRGLGFLFKTHDLHKKKKKYVRTLEYYFNLEVPILKKTEISYNLSGLIFKEAYIDKLINQKIYKNLSYEYPILNKVYKELELAYSVKAKMNNKKLRNILDVLFE